MKYKKILMFILLFTIGFQILHAFTFAEIDTNSCTVQEYTEEFKQPTDKGDICDIHFEYHMSYILPDNVNSITYIETKTPIQITRQVFKTKSSVSLFRPPINS